MRTTLEIILAVQENQPVEPEELRLALLALSTIDDFRRRQLDDVIDAFEKANDSSGSFRLGMRVQFSIEQRERLFTAMKTDPREWLGPTGLPESPEYQARRQLGKKIFEKATGQKL